MACCNCNSKETAKIYERVENGIAIKEEYCLDCYRRLFLYEKEAEGEVALSACPFCGAEINDVLTRKLVGCAHCYHALDMQLIPMIMHMQGIELHKGKKPTSDVFEDLQRSPFDTSEKQDPQFVKYCNELTLVIDKLVAEGRFDEAKDYADKLSRSKSTMQIEEGFVWRGNAKTRKGS